MRKRCVHGDASLRTPEKDGRMGGVKVKKFFAILAVAVLLCGVACADGMNRRFDVIEQVEIVNIRGMLYMTDLVYDVETLIVYYRTIGYGVSLTPYIMVNSFGSPTVGWYDPETKSIEPVEAFFEYEEDNGVEAFG